MFFMPYAKMESVMLHKRVVMIKFEKSKSASE